MLYFSGLKGKKVFTTEHIYLGKLIDVLFLGAETPLVTSLVIRKSNDENMLISVDAVKGVDSIIDIDKEYATRLPHENELSIMRSVMDRQIIDIKGSKVVRVNDVAIQDKLGKSWYLTGVDIGFRGILRWFNLEKPTRPLYRFTGLESRPHFLSWAEFEPLELEKGKVQLRKDVDSLERLKPEDLADYLEQTNIRNVNKVVASLDEHYAAEVIEDLNANFQSALFRRFTSERAGKLIELIDPEDAVDILLTLPKQKRKDILNTLTEKKQKKLTSLLKVSGTQIGHLITTDFIHIKSNASVQDAFSVMKEKARDIEFTYYIYVLNDIDQLVGVINIAELFRKNLTMNISQFMQQDMVIVHVTTPLNIAIKRMLKYKIYALPVLDQNKQLIGILRFNDVAESVLKEL